jgi:hypothetical protein
MPRNPNRTSEGQTPKKQKLPPVKDRLDKDGRATASAMTGHLRNKGDDRAYRWGRLPDFASPERPGVSGGLAPHHVLGLKRFAALTYGMSPEDIDDLNDNYMPPGRRMGEDNRYNYEYVEQDVKGGEGTMSGWHKKIHDSQDELFKKMGFTTKDGELYFYSQRFADMDPAMKKGLISHVAVQFDNDFDRVSKLASDDFYNRPPEVVEADLADIRKRGQNAPPRPEQDFRPTSKSNQVIMNEDWAQLQDPMGWAKVQASDYKNKILQTEWGQNAATALGKIKKTKLGAVAGGITGSVMSAKPGLADAKTLADATSSGDYTQLAVDTGVGAASGAGIQAGVQKATQAGMGWLGNAARALGTPLAALSTGKAIADVTFANEKVQRAYASAENPLDRWKALGAAWMSEEDFYKDSDADENTP